MRKNIFANLALLIVLLASMASAQTEGDLCHVYVVDVEKTRKIIENFQETGNREADAKTLSAGQTLFPEFRTVIGEEELITKNYPFPGSKFIITASVFYTDEFMASSEGTFSMLLGIMISPKVAESVLTSENSSLAEITFADRDTVRAKKYVKVNKRLYLVGIECHCKEKKVSN